MSGFLISLLAVTLLSGPDVAVGAATRASPPRSASPSAAAKAPEEKVRVTSRTSDFDGKEGVILFEGDVVVRYSRDFTMCADRLYMFLSGTNEVSRVVAIGSVSITNESRVGTCAMATYRRRRDEIEMLWGGKDVPARLAEMNGGAHALTGTRIRFWLGSEQVEVENTKITSEGKGGMKLL